MKRGMGSPWGTVDHVEELANGVWFVSTPSHGGIRLSDERNKEIPDYLRAATFNQQGERGWYEEDCDWCIPYLVLDDLNDMERCLIASDTLKAWKPELHARFFAEKAVRS